MPRPYWSLLSQQVVFVAHGLTEVGTRHVVVDFVGEDAELQRENVGEVRDGFGHEVLAAEGGELFSVSACRVYATSTFTTFTTFVYATGTFTTFTAADAGTRLAHHLLLCLPCVCCTS